MTLQKAVIHYPDRLVKGYVDVLQFHAASLAPDGDGSISLIQEGETSAERYSLANAKAVFIVRSFDGDDSRKDIHFHDGTEFLPRIWVKITFMDGEQIEGFVENNLDHILADRFQLQPSDPTSNNTAIFVLKNQIRNFQVLGLRP